MTSAPRAFVAMRIGHKETDAVFSNSIRPVLRSLGLTTIRIDKVEHNDDIDDRIVAEIERADLVVADLTFARPSAYFEAGFAEGKGTPVIYTCRKDHLTPQAADEFGNLRVHFDLQMKNIVAWTSPTDQGFQKRLQRRATYVLAPILRARTERREAIKDREAFRAMASNERLELLAFESERMLSGIGYKGVRGNPAAPFVSMALQWVGERPANQLRRSAWFGRRGVSGALDSVCLLVGESFRLDFLKVLNTLWSYSPLADMNPFAGTRVNRVVTHLILCSVQRLSPGRMHQAFPDYAQERPGLFSYDTQQFIPTRRLGDDVIFIGNLYGVWDAYGYPPGPYKYASATPRRYRAGRDMLEIPGVWPGDVVQAFKPPPKPELRGPAKEVPRQVRLHLVDGIESLSSFLASFGSVMP